MTAAVLLKHLASWRRLRKRQDSLDATFGEGGDARATHVRKQKMLTQKMGGTMLVEYMAANIAMAVTLMNRHYTIFPFISMNFTLETAVWALAAQHVPELICDFGALHFSLHAKLDIAAYLRNQFEPRQIALKFMSTVVAIVVMMSAMMSASLLHR